MLHRSFKPAKCKTSLKLAMSRIKLLKNKRKAQVTQLKRELAQLLESGQDQTARIRVEHVVREEKTVAAYDLIEIYCELIAARLPIIESQKNCPIDLKEAITSVIFASPRCADIPELMDVRKHFTAKYGKEFISSAIELRPECGVNRMLVEKLSALAPDGPTKIKILSAIAEEHNIKWEPKSFGEKDSKPPDDLLNGPNNFEKASKLHVEPPNVQAQHNRDQNHDIPVNHHEHNVRSSQSSQNFPSTDFGANKTTSATSHPEVRHPDTGAKGMDFRHSFSEDGNAFSSGRQNWNFEFKDATSAAQAAAESAERASMAARAAAELSSRGKIIRQYSTESQKSSVYGLSDEGPVKYAGSKLQGEHFIKDSVNCSFNDRNPRVQNEQVDGNEQDNLGGVAARFYRNDHGRTKRSSRSASLKSNVSSIDDDTLANSLQNADRYSQKSSSEVEAIKPEKGGFFGEVSMEKQSSKSGVEFVSGPQGGMKTENIDYFGEVRIGKQSSSVSSRSHSSTSGDDHDVILNSSRQKFENDAGEDPFLGIDRENIQRDTKQTNSYDNVAVAFDESGSDDDDGRFDVEGEYNGRESNLYFPSPYSESPTHLSVNTNAWSPTKNTSESLGKSISQSHFSTEWRSPPEFSESVTKSAVSSQPDDFLPASFDGSNDPSSESEEVEDKYKLRGRRDPSILPRKQNVYSRNPEPTQSESHGITESSLMEKGNNRQPWLRSSSDNLDYVDFRSEKNQGTELNAESQKKFSFRDLPTSQPSPRPTTSRLDSDDIDHESFYNPVDEGKLQQSPQPSRLSLVHEVKDKDSFLNPPSPDSMTDTEFLKQSSLESGKELNFGILTGGLRNKGYGHPPYSRTPSSVASSSSKQAAGDTSITIDQATASPRVDKSISSGAHDQESYNQSTKVIKKSSSRSPVTYFDSDNDNPEELPLQTLSSNQEPYNQKAGTEINEKLSSRTPITYFDSDSGDSVEDLPKQTSNSGGRSGTGFSRRTKASPSNSEMSSYSKLVPVSEASVTSDYRAEKKPSSRSSRATETLAKPKPQTMSSGHWRSSEQPRSSKQAASKPMPESKVSSGEERLKSSTMGQPSNPLPKIVTSGITESSKTSSSSGVTSSRENSIKKASHVHPKLPDYDTISAHLQSLRSNRQ